MLLLIFYVVNPSLNYKAWIILLISTGVMESQGTLGQKVARRRSSKEPNSYVSFLRHLVFTLRIVFIFYHSACRETFLSSRLFSGKIFALLSSWSWGIQFMTKPSPLLIAATRVPASNRTLRPQGFLTTAGDQAAPPPPQPSVGPWLGPSITSQLSWSGWWGHWTPWSPCCSRSITACCFIPHPSTGWKPSK